MRRASTAALWVIALAATACGERATSPDSVEKIEVAADGVADDARRDLEAWSDAWILAHAAPFLDDDGARRAGLEGSLTNPENLYARTRLGAYGRGRSGWDTLPVWRPRAQRIDAELAERLARGERPPIGDDVEPLGASDRPTTMAEWVALGERVFFELPLRSEPFWDIALRDPEHGEALGVERAPDGSVPGLVWMRDLNGRDAVGITCALCHTARAADGPDIVAGRARRRLDYGQIRIGYYEGRGEPVDGSVRRRWESWGPGRADVLEDVADTPIAIPDLWGLRHQRLLTQAGSIRHDSPLALAIRQETQYIQANHHRTRPDRALMFALAMYLYAIEPPPARPYEGSDRTAGALVFARECGRCHGDRIGSGDLVPLDEVATDPELGGGAARGTGHYRPAALIRVADAAPYMHDGSIESLDALFDPERETPGHRFGLELDPTERDALLAYLRSR